jgi:hypothetical protein
MAIDEEAHRAEMRAHAIRIAHEMDAKPADPDTPDAPDDPDTAATAEDLALEVPPQTAQADIQQSEKQDLSPPAQGVTPQTPFGVPEDPAAGIGGPPPNMSVATGNQAPQPGATDPRFAQVPYAAIPDEPAAPAGAPAEPGVAGAPGPGQGNAGYDAAQQMQAQQAMAHAQGVQDVRTHLNQTEAFSHGLARQSAGNARKNIENNDRYIEADIAAQQSKQYLQEQSDAEQAKIAQKNIPIREHAMLAKQQLDDWHAETLNTIMDRQNQFRDQMLQMANEHPEDVWGNASIGGKIAGVIGIIAASFPGGNPQALVDGAVRSAVAAHMRKAEFLSEANKQESLIAATAERLFGTKDAALKAMTASQYEIVANEMAMAAARYKNPIAQQALLSSEAQQRQRGNTYAAQARDAATLHQYQSLAVDRQNDTDRVNLLKADDLYATKVNKNALVPIPGRIGGVSKEASMKLAPIFSGGHSLIDGIDRLEKLSQKMREAEAHGGVGGWTKIASDYRAQYAAQKTGLIGPLKEFYRLGARWTAGDEKIFNTQFPTFLTSLTPDRITGEKAGFAELRDQIINNIHNVGDAYSMGTSEFDPNFVKYRSSSARMKERDNPEEERKQKVADAKQAHSDRQRAANHAVTLENREREFVKQRAMHPMVPQRDFGGM